MACSEHGDFAGFLFYRRECHLSRDFHARPSWPGRFAPFIRTSKNVALVLTGLLNEELGSVMAVL